MIVREVLAFCSILGLGACGSCAESSVGQDPCETPEPPVACGQECGPTAPCARGFYCTAGGTCTADCTAATGQGCRSSETCTADGRCVDAERDSSGCAHVDIGARLLTPNVIMIVDQSGSMNDPFSGAGTRWNVLRNALLGEPDGFIPALESQVRFGLALYSSENGGSDPTPANPPCPLLTTVAPDINNFNAIEPVYGNADPVEDTPTGDAIEAVLERYILVPDPPEDPTIFVLATDGEPDRCEQADPNPTADAQVETIDAVQRAFQNGVRTFLIDVGNGVSDEHKQDVANAGLGVPSGGPDAPFWTVTDVDGLRGALGAIIGTQLSCDVQLQGRITSPEAACNGTVLLNDQPVPCNDPNGWEYVSPSQIRLVGDACDRLLGSVEPTLRATFPCDDVELI